MPTSTQARSGNSGRLEANPAPIWLSISDAATYTGLCEKTIRRLMESGKIIGRRPVRKRVLINRAELDSYILGCTE